MKVLQQNVIKYLTYLVLNKRKLDNKQTPSSHPKEKGTAVYTTRAHLPKKA
jgi:hypothetical protein